MKGFGKSAAKFDALGSLARTDDMLAVIGIIMLVGVIVSSYGAFWQGRLASAQYKKECTASGSPVQQDEQKKSVKYTVLMVSVTVLILGLMVYIFRKQFRDKITSVVS